MGRPRKDALDATDSNTLNEERFGDAGEGIGQDATAAPMNNEDYLQQQNEAKDVKMARMEEELKRMSRVLTEVAKNQSIPDGIERKEFYDGEGFVPFTRDGKRFVSWEATSSFEEMLGEAMQKHFVYKITYVDKNGVETVEENVPHRLLKNKFADAVKMPAILPNYLQSVREGDHYVYRSVPSLAKKPFKNTDLVDMVLGRTLPDGKTKIYDGEKIKAYFYTFNAS